MIEREPIFLKVTVGDVIHMIGEIIYPNCSEVKFFTVLRIGVVDISADHPRKVEKLRSKKVIRSFNKKRHFEYININVFGKCLKWIKNTEMRSFRQ